VASHRGRSTGRREGGRQVAFGGMPAEGPLVPWLRQTYCRSAAEPVGPGTSCRQAAEGSLPVVLGAAKYLEPALLLPDLDCPFLGPFFSLKYLPLMPQCSIGFCVGGLL
uniref:Uncharacterized protein n=1 Tax=Chelonoidis abingdonii TaxID=106734 RepID=A0A8C0IUK6_CHEAB